MYAINKIQLRRVARILNSKLDKLVYIYSVDTSSFYNDIEHALDQQLIMVKQFKSNIKELTTPLNKFMIQSNKLFESEELDKEEKDKRLHKLEEDLIDFVKRFYIFFNQIDDYLIYDKEKNIYKVNNKSTLYISEQYLNKAIRELKNKLDAEAKKHMGKRLLRKDSLKNSNKISLFESTLTRSLEIKEDELSTDIIVVRAYRYVIFESLIKKGFRFNGEDYEYFSSSAGQIRNKKSCFIRKNALNANNHNVRNKLMCGLSVNKINRNGGINQNKFQAYLSLTNSASSKWDGFNIDKCIVVDDMELKVTGLVDYINHETYEISRMEKTIPINFTDGSGIVLPSVSERSFQFRMPFFKGLLIPFDFLSFVRKYPNASFTVKDIYNKSYDILKDDIKIIFTKSQFKLHGYYKNWDDYKKYFKKFNCEASICKIEEDIFEDKPINYQMIQSLNFSDEELKMLANKTVSDILEIGENKDTMLRLLGADKGNTKKNYFQKALSIYPELLSDPHSKQTIKDRKRSLVKEAKSGKILLEGTKRAYISPDLYAFAEWLFAGVQKPNGLLQNGEVSCRLFNNERLDVLRSPHLFREHCVRQNIVNDKTKEWFVSNCIYTSVNDMISKQLMFDVDGDDALIVKNELFVNRAEEQMKEIVPLEYTLATSKKSKVTNEHIVKSLKAAYSKNIGEISNLITKIWNSGDKLTNDEMDLIKILCMENNAIIDFAKTLWMPKRSETVDKEIKKYAGMRVPYFFHFAKDKEKDRVEKINNSTINRLTKIIPDKRINFTSVAGKFDYKNLMKNKRQKIDDKLSREIIETYIEADRNKSNQVKKQVKENNKSNMQTEIQVYKEIRSSLLKIDSNVDYVADVLVKYLFDEKNSKFKDTLWRCFGQEIVRNLKKNLSKTVECIDCRCEVRIKRKQQLRCDHCQSEHVKRLTRIRVEKHRKCNAE